MKACPKCNHIYDDDQTMFCTVCGTDLSGVAPRGVLAPPYQMAPILIPQNTPLSWQDAFAIIGFVAAIIGLFWCSAILHPLGIVCTLIGYFSKKTKGLALAGLVISVIGLLIKLFVELHRAGLIPEWLTRGIF